MPRTCILTDSTAQFTNPIYEGQENVNILSLHVQVGDDLVPDSKDPRISQKILANPNGNHPVAISPTVEAFSEAFTSLGRNYQNILAILNSTHLSQTIANAQTAAELVKGPAAVHIIDSQTTAVGLGLLVQAAAKVAQEEVNPVRITRYIRSLIPHIYTVFCLQSLSYLANSGYLDPAQALVGEMLGLIPFYILENGRLIPVQKARNPRQLVDMLDEFVTEFEHLEHIALMQGFPPYDQEVRNLRERIMPSFPGVTLSEHTLSTSLISMFGPRSLGLVVMEA